MTDRPSNSLQPEATAAAPGSAGAMLKAARQQQGLHLVALAAAIKVTPAKLEALEAGRHDELPDLTFVRALTLTVCRQLRIDPAPVLAQLPGAPVSGLERVDGGLNTPFRERSGAADPARWLPWHSPVPWAVGALLVAAAAFVLVPMRGDLLAPGGAAAPGAGPVMPPATEASAPLATEAPAAAATAVSVPASAQAVGAAASAAPAPPVGAPDAPVTATAAAAPAPAAAASDGAVLRAVQDTWVQVVDGGGQTLTARLIPAGETVEFSGKLPLKLRIGNVRGTELSFRGQPVDLRRTARDNTANLTLQ